MIHYVFANKSNIGDWLSALGIQSLLSSQPLTEHFCDEPFVAATLRQLALAPTGDFIVIGGGGLFMDYFFPFWEGFREIADRTPFCIWGVGHCDMKRQMSRPPEHLISEIIQKSQWCTVRDELTRSHLPSCQLPPPSGCPSLCAVEPPPEAGWGVLHVDNYDNAGPDVYDFMEQCAHRFAEITQRPVRKTNNRIQAGHREGLAGVLQRYADSDIVLSSALHGCILGVAMRKKVLAVSGDRKIESFMQAAGLGDWVCDISDASRLPDLFHRVAQQPTGDGFVNTMRHRNSTFARQVLSARDGAGKWRRDPLALALNRKA